MAKKKEGKIAEKNMTSKKKVKGMEMGSLTNVDTLTKLRLAVGSIFVLFTLTIVIAIAVPKQAVIAFVIGLIGYIMLFGLMIKLLLVKKL